MLLFCFIEVVFIWSFIKIQNIFFAVSSGLIIPIVVQQQQQKLYVHFFYEKQNHLEFLALQFHAKLWNEFYDISFVLSV